MKLQRAFLWLTNVLVLLAFVGCAQMGVAPTDTFNKKLAAGYTTLATVADSAALLYRAGKLTKDEAKHISDSNALALSALDASALTFKTDPVAANDRLTATIAALTAAQALLAQHEGVPK